MFKPVSPKVDFPKLEEEILKYWKRNKIFEKSVEKEAPLGTWTFLDGPPFITGLPHYGSLLSSIPKDLFPRFKTMQGYRVRRVWGWDCHGLPAENKVEIELGLKNKKEIAEKVGIKKFIEECKFYVGSVSSEWEWYIDHIGRWVDFKNAYKTMDLSYMESVMWIFRKMHDKGFIYKGLRVLLYCPHCATPISNFEVAMDPDNYKMLKDPSATYKYELKVNPSTSSGQKSSIRQAQDDPELIEGSKVKTYILAWSTTPWNKIVTPALAVNPKLTYVKVRQGLEEYILAKETIKMLKKELSYKIVEEFKGEKLIGKRFVPHFDYYKIEKGKEAFVVIGGNFVTAEEGTGIVTLAAYGEEDLPAMQANNIHVEMHLDGEGMIKNNVPKFGGMYYLKANKAVNEDLKKRGLIYQDKEYAHSVPTCWRCATRLYQAPQNAWYVNVQKLKDKMKKSNEKVNWFPKHFKHGRFLKSLEKAPDWNISRNRYWGTPVPVWECKKCGKRFVPGSIKELEERSGQKITDLHKPEIDEVTVICDKCGDKAYRVPEVLDSWIEAGSASFGERHYPFEGDLKVEDFYPPDFIGEYTGQIRAWFYVLHVISTALAPRDDGFNMLSKNVLVEGVILGTDGRKMSKNYNNYPDPKELLQKYGGDALRLYLMGSPVMNGEDILISEEQYRNQVKGIMLILWNSYIFFATYANIGKWNCVLKTGNLTVLDKWILARLTKLVLNVTRNLEEFKTVEGLKSLEDFVINDFSTWYIRRSRERVGFDATDDERNTALSVMYGVLVNLSKLLAPFTPFIAEEIFRNLTGEESVHLQSYPKGDKSLLDFQLIEDMKGVRKIVELGHAKRKTLGIKVRQPLAEFTIYNLQFTINEELIDLIKDELNVKRVVFKKDREEFRVDFDKNITKELRDEGEARDIVRLIQEERKKIGTSLDEKVDVVLKSWPASFDDYIKKNALVENIKKGDKFSVVRNE
ncbi:MAG: isoleucine--tRNA ligase [Patescibacteria group bacterium]